MRRRIRLAALIGGAMVVFLAPAWAVTEPLPRPGGDMVLAPSVISPASIKLCSPWNTVPQLLGSCEFPLCSLICQNPGPLGEPDRCTRWPAGDTAPCSALPASDRSATEHCGQRATKEELCLGNGVQRHEPLVLAVISSGSEPRAPR